MEASERKEDDEIVASINVTPLVDITLVLLIIFMITAHFMRDPVIPVELPRAANVEEGKIKSFSLILDRDGKLYVNGRESSPETAVNMLKDAVKNDPEINAIIAADGKVLHEQVIWLIDLVKSAGVNKFALNVKRYEVEQ